MPRKRAESRARARGSANPLVEPVPAAEGGVERSVRRVVGDERLAELELESGAVGHGQAGRLGVDLTRDLVLPALVCALALEDA
jgi:hypothetical protein